MGSDSFVARQNTETCLRVLDKRLGPPHPLLLWFRAVIAAQSTTRTLTQGCRAFGVLVPLLGHCNSGTRRYGSMREGNLERTNANDHCARDSIIDLGAPVFLRHDRHHGSADLNRQHEKTGSSISEGNVMIVGNLNFGMSAISLSFAAVTGCAAATGNRTLHGGPLFGSNFACLALNTTDSALPVTLRLHRDDGSINTSLSLPIEPGKVRFVEDDSIREQMRYCTAQYVGPKGAVKAAFCVVEINNPGHPICISSVPLE